MVKRIIVFSLTGLLFISLLLYFVGVRRIEFDNTFYRLYFSLSKSLNYDFVVPNLQPIVYTASSDFFSQVLGSLVYIANLFTGPINFAINIINYLIKFVNSIFAFIGAVIEWVQSFNV